MAAATPQLTATVVPGKEIDVTGSGFPADATVAFVASRNGGPGSAQSLKADSSGSFTTTIDAGPGRGGAYQLVATAGPLKAVTSVVAVETAGGSGGGVRPTAPATDLASGGASRGGGDFAPALVWILAGCLVVLLLSGAFGRRLARG